MLRIFNTASVKSADGTGKTWTGHFLKCSCFNQFVRSQNATYLYPYSRLSPQPPQIQSRWRSRGRPVREHPQELSCPSRHDRDMACTTPAAPMACAKAASRLAETETWHHTGHTIHQTDSSGIEESCSTLCNVMKLSTVPSVTLRRSALYPL